MHRNSLLSSLPIPSLMPFLSFPFQYSPIPFCHSILLFLFCFLLQILSLETSLLFLSPIPSLSSRFLLTPLLSPPSLIPPCNSFPSPFSHIQHLSVISLVISKSDDHRVMVWGLHNQAPVLIAMSRSSCRHNKQLRIQLLK